jgi:hypothetical protein
MCGPSSTVAGGSITPTESADGRRCPPLVYGARLTLARRLAAVRLHRSAAVQDGPACRQCKRRMRWAGGLLRLGNAYLRIQRMPVRILPLGEWLQWERQVADVLGREARISPDGTGLETPFLTGETLAEILGGPWPPPDKLLALQLAARALRLLHLKSVRRSESESWVLSHGDATCHNVVVNLSAASADWIDFDLRHAWECPAIERQADDLRALAFSSAACLPAALHANCVNQTLAGYGEPRVAAQLKKWLGDRLCPAVFQLAQGPLARADFFRLCRLLAESKPALIPTAAS